MNHFVRSIAVLLLSACLAQGVVAQFFFTGPGFLPDENGTNLDATEVSKETLNVASTAAIKDCTECLEVVVIPPEMVVIPAGSFSMGSNKRYTEQPTHSVKLRSFLIGKTEVTQMQWESVMGNNPSKNKGLTLPVETVSWDEIQQFIAKLNLKTGHKYRLPSEAEWEYAARAGTTTQWSFGDDESKMGYYAWYSLPTIFTNSMAKGGSRNVDKGSNLTALDLSSIATKTREVGQKLPNAFGLFDMYGNVWELTQDCWHESYVDAPADGSAWTTFCGENRRVLRGGSWTEGPANSCSSNRSWINSGSGTSNIGFRLARDL